MQGWPSFLALIWEVFNRKKEKNLKFFIRLEKP
jgi:hypothetical protein